MAGALGCGNSGNVLMVGSDADAGSAFRSPVHGADAGLPSLSVSAGPGDTVLCSGQCAALSARATGGKEPYAYRWSQTGVPDEALVTVCPRATTMYTVTATDSSGTTKGEVQAPSATGSASVTVTVGSCVDAAVPLCDGGGNDAVLTSGRYAGTFYCADADGGVVAGLFGSDGGPITGSLWIDLTIDAATAQQTGTLYGQWVILGLITLKAPLQGTLDCARGEVRMTWTDGVWGLPGPADTDGSAPVTVIQTGTLTGDLTASVVNGSPGKIAGSIDWLSNISSNGSGVCHGTFSATLQ
jgi:hypothetical protein